MVYYVCRSTPPSFFRVKTIMLCHERRLRARFSKRRPLVMEMIIGCTLHRLPHGLPKHFKIRQNSHFEVCFVVHEQLACCWRKNEKHHVPANNPPSLLVPLQTLTAHAYARPSLFHDYEGEGQQRQGQEQNGRPGGARADDDGRHRGPPGAPRDCEADAAVGREVPALVARRARRPRGHRQHP